MEHLGICYDVFLAEGVDSTMSFAFHARGVLDFFRRGSEKPFPPANFAGDYVRNSEGYFLLKAKFYPYNPY